MSILSCNNNYEMQSKGFNIWAGIYADRNDLVVLEDASDEEGR